MNSITNWGKWALALSGWVTAIFLGLLDLPAKINSFVVEAPKAAKTVDDWWSVDSQFSGVWTSNVEGHVDATDADREMSRRENGPVTMRIHVRDGQLDGEIFSEGLKKNYVFSLMMLRGQKQRGSLDGEVFDYVSGKPTTLATFRIERLRNGSLYLRTLSQSGQFLPSEANLHRTDESALTDKGEYNSDLFNSVITKNKTKRHTEELQQKQQ